MNATHGFYSWTGAAIGVGARLRLRGGDVSKIAVSLFSTIAVIAFGFFLQEMFPIGALRWLAVATVAILAGTRIEWQDWFSSLKTPVKLGAGVLLLAVLAGLWSMPVSQPPIPIPLDHNHQSACR